MQYLIPVSVKAHIAKQYDAGTKMYRIETLLISMISQAYPS